MVKKLIKGRTYRSISTGLIIEVLDSEGRAIVINCASNTWYPNGAEDDGWNLTNFVEIPQDKKDAIFLEEDRISLDKKNN